MRLQNHRYEHDGSREHCTRCGEPLAAHVGMSGKLPRKGKPTDWQGAIASWRKEVKRK